MAEYIDREALLELINEDCKYQNPTNEYTRGCNEVCDWAIKTIKNIPTADVVPKSEVDKWYHEYHEIKDSLKQEKMYHRETEKLADRYCAELQTAKTEIVRLEKLSDDLGIDVDNKLKYIYQLEEKINELQKNIFEEIEEQIDRGLAVITKILNAKGGRANGKTVLLSKYDVFIESKKYIAELKKKYTEGAADDGGKQ